MPLHWLTRSLVRLSLAAETGYAVVALLFMSDGFGLQLGPAVLRYSFYIVYLVSFILVVLRWKKTISVINRGKFHLLLVGVAVLSLIWTIDPRYTNLKVRDLVGVSLFAVYLATRFDLKQQLRLLGWMCGISAVFSLFYGVGMPGIGTDPKFNGAWRGIFRHKNLLARMMSLSAIIHFLLARSGVKYPWLSYGLCGLSFVLMKLSTSAGGLIITLNLLLLIPVYKLLRFRSMALGFCIVFGGLLGTVMTTWLVDNLSSIFDALGKDMTLTGRVPLWQMLFRLIPEHLWLGYGYQSFWQGWKSPAAYVWRYSNWHPPHAHNGFIDLVIDLGLVGLFVFTIGYVISLVRGVMWIRLFRSEEALWPMLYMTFFFIANLPESSLLRHSSGPFWLFYLATSLLQPTSYEPTNQIEPPSPNSTEEQTQAFPKPQNPTYRHKNLN